MPAGDYHMTVNAPWFQPIPSSFTPTATEVEINRRPPMKDLPNHLREIPDVYCTVCGNKMDLQIEPSTYLNTRVTLIEIHTDDCIHKGSNGHRTWESN